jgi:hypothetical protein
LSKAYAKQKKRSAYDTFIHPNQAVINKYFLSAVFSHNFVTHFVGEVIKNTAPKINILLKKYAPN